METKIFLFIFFLIFKLTHCGKRGNGGGFRGVPIPDTDSSGTSKNMPDNSRPDISILENNFQDMDITGSNSPSELDITGLNSPSELSIYDPPPAPHNSPVRSEAATSFFDALKIDPSKLDFFGDKRTISLQPAEDGAISLPSAETHEGTISLQPAEDGAISLPLAETHEWTGLKALPHLKKTYKPFTYVKNDFQFHNLFPDQKSPNSFRAPINNKPLPQPPIQRPNSAFSPTVSGILKLHKFLISYFFIFSLQQQQQHHQQQHVAMPHSHHIEQQQQHHQQQHVAMPHSHHIDSQGQSIPTFANQEQHHQQQQQLQQQLHLHQQQLQLLDLQQQIQERKIQLNNLEHSYQQQQQLYTHFMDTGQQIVQHIEQRQQPPRVRFTLPDEMDTDQQLVQQIDRLDLDLGEMDIGQQNVARKHNIIQ